MSTKYYYKNKKNDIFRILLVLPLIAFYYPLTLFYISPSEHIWWRMPSEIYVLMFSIFGYIVISFSIIVMFKLILKKGYVKINNEGIYNDFFFSNKKNLKWNEIESIRLIKYNQNLYLGFFLKKNEFGKKRGFDYLAHKLNISTFGTGHFIHSSFLNCTFMELVKEVNKRFPKGIDT
ncbi:STM3941 family protein [Polaribacter gangjinensis]|uniref:Uncharacterized protein n=1 Tax=Polaribacter gangjinensis TaxID=574710 RepID=A0A2S7W9A4_9FLAO|nr:STM3941 family protein [Polaribacter gangjinensis]PQJ74163.1 hypothetical protein BTO13_02235 [Polaribacter gangjinensis]